jgi:glucose/mannose transport system substrate-binding protein
LKILAGGNVLPSGDILLSPDTSNQINELMTTFWSDMYMSAEDAQAKYAKIIATAD